MSRTVLRDRGLPPSQYRAYIDSSAWTAKREWWKQGRSTRRRRCRVCGDRYYQLHHRTYVRLGRERRRDLVPLCSRHHAALGDLQNRMDWTVERATAVYLAFHRAISLIPLLLVAGVLFLLLT